MGSSGSCCSTQERSHVHENTDSELRDELIAITIKKEFKSCRLNQFHHSDLVDILNRHHKPKLMQQSHYSNMMLQMDILGAYNQIKQSIMELRGSFFGMILKTYFKFLENLFIDLQVTNILRGKMSNSRCLFLPSTQLTSLKIRAALRRTTSAYVKELADSFTTIMEMLRVCIVHECVVNTINTTYNNDDEIIIQRVMQYFIFIHGSIGQVMIEPLLQELYRDELQKNRNVVINSQEKVEELDQSLRPMPCEDEKYEQVWESSNRQSMDSMLEYCNKKTKQNPQEFSLKSMQMEDEETQKIPYHQTFKIIKVMNSENKFWRVWRLIETLDAMLVQIFLGERNSTEALELLNNITAEDNKSDIMLYLLSKYSQEVESLEHLFCMVQFMYQYDAVLPNKIKFIYSPAFIRFYTILGMVQQGQVYKI